MSVPLRNCDHQALSQVIHIREVADTYPLMLENAEPLTEDVGTNPKDIAQVKLMTSCAVGAPIEEGGSGDPSPMTAFGVMERIKALTEEVLGSKSLVGIRVAIQGLGKVGMNLVE